VREDRARSRRPRRDEDGTEFNEAGRSTPERKLDRAQGGTAREGLRWRRAPRLRGSRPARPAAARGQPLGRRSSTATLRLGGLRSASTPALALGAARSARRERLARAHVRAGDDADGLVEEVSRRAGADPAAALARALGDRLEVLPPRSASSSRRARRPRRRRRCDPSPAPFTPTLRCRREPGLGFTPRPDASTPSARSTARSRCTAT
jgi:hypothetical protein